MTDASERRERPAAGVPARPSEDAAGDQPAASTIRGGGEAGAASAGGAGDGLPAPVDLDERVVDTRVLHRGRYLEYRVLTVERADGSRSTREIVGHPGAVAMIAVDDADRVLLVRQYRAAAGATLLEIPAGTLDVDAATGEVEDPDVAAARELEEETGYRAGRLERIGQFWTAPGFATELMTLYLATDLRPADADRLGPDADEHLELAHLPWREALAAVEHGEIRDAKSIIGLLRLARMREEGTDRGPVREPDPGDGRLVDVGYPLTLRQYLWANVALATESTSSQVSGAIAAAAGVLVLLLGDAVFGLLMIAFGAALVTGLITLPFVAYQLRKRPDMFRGQARLTADERGIRYSAPFGSGVYPWTAFTRIRERGGFVFLDTGAGPNLFVPTRALPPADLERFRTLAALHIDPSRG